MDSIYQRLKEMDPDTFQRFSFQVLKEQHPGLELRHVEGKSGDDGLDLFVGELSGNPTIWQCKAFANGVGKSQKEQIKHSLRTALKNFRPAFWILCLSVDLDPKTHRWFQKLKKSYESRVNIGLILASDFINEVLHRRTIRNHFFPSASIDIAELKRLVLRTGEMTLEDLESVTSANVEDIIERLKERDARFDYQIVFDGDLGPPAPSSIPPRLMMSISKAGKTLNVFARDVVSLRSNPPQFHTTFKGSGIKKYIELVKTGLPQEFEADELDSFESDFSLMDDVARAGPYKMKVGPSPMLTNKRRSVRVEFVGADGTTIRYELMEFRPVRHGTDEFEVSLSARNVPFTISIVVSIPNRSATIHIQLVTTERNPRIIKRSLDALNLLRPGKMRIFDLESEIVLMEQDCGLAAETQWQAGRRAFVNDVVAISDRFGVSFRLPLQKLDDSDLETIFVLKQYMQNGALELDNLTLTIVKSEGNRDLLPQQLSGGRGFFRFANTLRENTFVLFGTSIDTGPVVMETEAEINNLKESLAEFESAQVGSGVQLSLRPLAPVRVSLLSSGLESPDLGSVEWKPN